MFNYGFRGDGDVMSYVVPMKALIILLLTATGGSLGGVAYYYQVTSYISQQPGLKSQQQRQLTERPNCRPQGRNRKSHKPDLPSSDDQLSTQPDLSSIPIARNPTRNSKCATPVAGNSTLQRNQQSPITRIIIQHST